VAGAPIAMPMHRHEPFVLDHVSKQVAQVADSAQAIRHFLFAADDAFLLLRLSLVTRLG
jgi:hypothetical protein